MWTDTKLILAGGATFMALVSVLLIWLKIEKEVVLIFTGFTGQFIAALLTYVNSNKKPPEVKP